METPKDELLKDILEYFNVSYTQFDGFSRTKNIVRARQVYCYVLHLNGIAINDIAIKLGRDHSTISYAVKIIKNEIETNDAINNLVTNLFNKYRNEV